jgi:membrane-associated phospholipid phosphatase
MTRATLLILLWLAVPARAVLAPAPAAGQGDPEPVETAFWTPHYMVDYGLTAGGLVLGLFVDLSPRDPARWGPSFDPANPSAILAAEHARLLGEPFTPRRDWTMSDGWVHGIAIGHVLVIPVHEIAVARVTGRPVSAHRLHNAVLAAGEATAATAGVVMLTKAATGRLRPDFQDRVRHVYCSLPDPAGIDCQGVDPDRLFPDAETALTELEHGRESFPSGHAATGMVVATNLALQIGGHWVWGEAATPASRAGGITTMALLMGLGTVPGITRTSAMDGVHHTSDVVIGGILGVTMGGLFYWLHFDSAGKPRPGHWLTRNRSAVTTGPVLEDVRLVTAAGGVGIQARWSTP